MNTKSVVRMLAALALTTGCGRGREPARADAHAPRPRPSILLVTMDTTRADSIGPEPPV